MRPRTSVVMPNQATLLQQYRNNTASMHFYVTPDMQVCPCCKRRRSSTQFTADSRYCANCRRAR